MNGTGTADTIQPDDDEGSVVLTPVPTANDLALKMRLLDANGEDIDLNQPLAAGTTIQYVITAYNYSATKDAGNATIIVDLPESAITLSTATSTGTPHINYPKVVAPDRAQDWEEVFQDKPSWILWQPDDTNATKLNAGASATLTITATLDSNLSTGSLAASAWWSKYGMSAPDVDSTDSGNQYEPALNDLATDDVGDVSGLGDPDDDEGVQSFYDDNKSLNINT
ncbi:MAG: hypothetical protein GY795_14525 [Desulfobacterales bacterium]|nr:hypothetical protein [Desulfobacterales bacterium]